jgi:hypothetical protein
MQVVQVRRLPLSAAYANDSGSRVEHEASAYTHDFYEI